MLALPVAMAYDRLNFVLWGAIALFVIGVLLYTAFYVFAISGVIIWEAFRHPRRLVVSFFVIWAVLSAPVWVFYGWAAAVAMVLAVLWTALTGGMDEDRERQQKRIDSMRLPDPRQRWNDIGAGRRSAPSKTKSSYQRDKHGNQPDSRRWRDHD